MAWRKEAEYADRQLHSATGDFARSNRFSEYARLRDRDTLKVSAHRPTPLSINLLGFKPLEDALCVPHPVPWTHIYDYATWCSSYSSRAAIGV